MTSFETLTQDLYKVALDQKPQDAALQLLTVGEQVLELWVEGHDKVPTKAQKEGFRLLALHSQGAKGVPSFNACRETCRELVYHYNLVVGEPGHKAVENRLEMMALVANHLLLFVSGKMEVEGLGEFCCASKPLRAGNA